MKTCFYTLFILLSVSLLPLYAAAQDGTLDSTFGGGIVIDSIGPGATYVAAVKVQPDYKTLVAASVWDSDSTEAIVLLRYNEDGTPDTSFGTAGRAFYRLGARSVQAPTDMALLPDGRILLCGYVDSTQHHRDQWFAMRVLADGTIDRTFATAGYQRGGYNSYYNSVPGAMAVDPASGHIGLAGTKGGFPYICQLRSDGLIDSAFGHNGYVYPDQNNPNYDVKGVAYRPDGRLLVGGRSQLYPYTVFVSAYLTDGTPDATFGTGGTVTKSTIGYDTEISGMVLQPDGKIVMGGHSTDAQGSYLYTLIRFTADGMADIGFNRSGMVMVPTGGYEFRSYDLALAADGKYLLAGVTQSGFPLSQYTLVRFYQDGIIDASFGTGGRVTTTVSPDDLTYLYAIDQAPDGRIVGAGYIFGSHYYTAAVRYLTVLRVGITDLHTRATAALIYPNPIQPTETLRYTLSTDEKVSITLHSTDGKLIQEFITDQPRTSGENTETLHFTEGLASGTYILRLSTAQGECSIRVVK